LGEKNNPRSMRALAEAAQALPASLGTDQARVALEATLKLIGNENEAAALSTLAQALRALATKLTDGQLQADLDPLLNTIAVTTNPEKSLALAPTLQVLAGRLSAEQTVKALLVARGRLANARLEKEGEAWSNAIAHLARPLGDKDYVLTLTDALKYPTTV